MKIFTSATVIASAIFFSQIALAGYGTHTVREYTRSNGTTVQEHESGNPYSGIHCHNDECS